MFRLLIFITWLYSFEPEQLRVLNDIWEKAKPFDLSYTMTAIAWEESQFGKYMINLQDPSCGVFHIMPSTLSGSKWDQSRLCERLIKDFDFSFSTALERYKYFYNYYRSKGYSKNISWKRAICSYNAGWNWKQGLKYYKKIVKKIKYLRRYNDK